MRRSQASLARDEFVDGSHNPYHQQNIRAGGEPEPDGEVRCLACSVEAKAVALGCKYEEDLEGIRAEAAEGAEAVEGAGEGQCQWAWEGAGQVPCEWAGEGAG